MQFFYIDYSKAPSTSLNGSSSSVISSITTTFSFRNIDQNDSSVKNSTQFKSSKHFPDISIYLEVTNFMSDIENNLLKKVVLKSTTVHQCYTSKTVK